MQLAMRPMRPGSPGVGPAEPGSSDDEVGKCENAPPWSAGRSPKYFERSMLEVLSAFP